MSGAAKIFTREELRRALRYWADQIASVSLNPDTPEACADYTYEHFGIETDINPLKENHQ
ncbi:hypothetical protein CS006_10475 [Bifidobacterium primatium]|uniref:Uncharacterized protein n=2 Tax=Bifidobacterium TaxID=1678 RepID=A0A2M9H6A4_9BIFI|nr:MULTISPECIES: hypothetical protein [Bifidobacterium]NEG95995.1 hypothetical protein [Bifidobacterium sp. SMB2]NEH12460.1 hypothetical protein [Bifidobacterium saimiriisciurei]PJM72352.1 hypothetical protein CS006_10475 [Bifidobacterium primatium]